MTHGYSIKVSHKTDHHAIVAEMIDDGFAADVADWLSRFAPVVPGALVGRYFEITVDEGDVPFTADEIKALYNAAEQARESVDVYRTVDGHPAVMIDEGCIERLYKIADNGEVVEIE